MKKKLLVAVGVVIVGLVAAHQYTASRVSSQVDRFAQGLAAHGTLEHGRVWVSPFGTVRVNNLEFQPHSGGDAITADRLLIEAESLGDLRNLGRGDSAEDVPRQLRVALEGIRLDLGGSLFEAYWQQLEAGDSLVNFETSGCGDRSHFSYADLDQMGYSSTVSDLALDYRFSSDRSRLDMGGEFIIHDMYGVEYSADVRLDPETADNPAQAMMSLSLRRAELSLVDAGYVDNVLAFCARETDLDVADYRQRHLQAWQADWQQLGVDPGENLTAAYATFLENPGRLSLATYTGLDPMQVAMNPTPQAILTQLDPQIRANGGEPRPLDLALVEPDPRSPDPAATEAPSEPAPGAARAPDASEPAPEAQPEPSVRRLTPAELTDHLNQPVAVILNDGRRFDGAILAVEERQLRFRQAVEGGTMEMPLNRDEIAEVWLR